MGKKPKLLATMLSGAPFVLEPRAVARAITDAGFDGCQAIPLRRGRIEWVAEAARISPPYLYEEPWKWVPNLRRAVYGHRRRHHRWPTLYDYFFFGLSGWAGPQLDLIRGIPLPGGGYPVLVSHDLDGPDDSLYEISPSSWCRVSEIIKRTPRRRYVIDTRHISRMNLEPDEITRRPESCRHINHSILGDWEETVPLLLETGRVVAVHVKAFEPVDRAIIHMARICPSIEAYVLEEAGLRGRLNPLGLTKRLTVARERLAQLVFVGESDKEWEAPIGV